MAKIETRQFGSKKFLLIVTENSDEAKLVNGILGNKEPRTCNGTIQEDDSFVTYIRLQSGKQEAKETK